jgi:hypothetical protein
MADDTTVSKKVTTGTSRARIPTVNVEVTIQLPPITVSVPVPAPAPEPLPPPPVMLPTANPDPAPPVPPPPPVDPNPEPTTPWYRPGHLWWYFRHAVHVVSDTLDYFYKKWHFWMWTAVLSLPSIYDYGVQNHYITSAMVPPLMTKLISSIAFFGAASQMIKKKAASGS